MTEEVQVQETSTTQYCAYHPQVESTLRCNRCDKPICARCAVRTPTGYRCKECVRGQQKVFNTAQWYDYPLGFIITLILAFIGSRLAGALGFFGLLLAPIAGVAIAEAVRFIIRRRRSKLLFQTIAVAAAFGSLPMLLVYLLGGFNLFGLLIQGFYLVTVTSSVYVRLSGISIR